MRYTNIHRQQLFHWIGSHLDVQCTNGKLTDALRGEYVKCLEGAIQRGIWLKTPRDPDQLGDGSLVKVTRPICCFTEWSLGQSLPHTSKYGRLGLGFPKRFILGKGGQPVIYIRDTSRTDPYTKSLKGLAALLKGTTLEGKIPVRELGVAREWLEYLSHFNKRIRKPTVKRTKTLEPKRIASPRVYAADPFARSYGGTLHYLEEREWRIVFDKSISKFFDVGPGTPEHYLKFTPGKELFTVVLPDNKTVNLALQNQTIQRAIFPPNAPHVTVLSLQDVGTF